MQSIYDNFLKHLEVCSGCLGPRKLVTCSYRGVCATAERLAQTGKVKDADELRAYGSFDRTRYRRSDFEYPRRVK